MSVKQILMMSAVVAMLGSCGESEEKGHSICLDMNRTTSEPIVARSLTCSTEFTDTASTNADGIYTFDISQWPADIYRLDIGATDHIDVVVNGRESMSIVARRNFCHEATTDNHYTQLLWQTDSLQRRLNTALDTIVARHQPLTNAENRREAAAAINRCRKDVRLLCDSLLALTDTSIVSLAVLKVGNGTANAYDLIDDFGLMKKYTLNVESRFAQNAIVRGMLDDLTEVETVRNAIHRFGKGKQLPRIDFTDKYGNERNTTEYIDLPHVLVFGTEPTDELLKAWQRVLPRRFDGVSLIGLIPEATDRVGKINTTFGLAKENADTEMLRQFEPVIITVDAHGEIQSVELHAKAPSVASK